MSMMLIIGIVLGIITGLPDQVESYWGEGAQLLPSSVSQSLSSAWATYSLPFLLD